MATAFTTVDEYLDAQSPGSRAAIEALRAIVLGAHPGVSEHLKWNSPSFVVDGVDRATVNVDRAGAVRLVLHQGAVKPEHAGAATAFAGDPAGLLTWHSDIRASLPIGGAADLAQRRDEIAAVIAAWLAFAP
ncbi:DUF1801 domain-containing protein [Pengzhenrongella sicca]|uniref:DUF1801 domain-containing protein n=1 Tax=Pengzhenrongella sicca TaxID=2819238 RepID=A0A8A4ZCK5_9MICO|nr:DUF1801 domain-containing protein [Pengzhenrongella sicca]QTE28227.1 DUF1801 domain-containing protein [Pengzhenrongella sicca]